MKKKELNELIEKDVSEIEDYEIDYYIKRYVKFKHINKAKIAAIALVPAITLGTMAGTVFGGLANVNKPYYETETYNVRYMDEETDVILQTNVKESEIEDNIITIEYPYEEFQGYYVRKISTLTTDDDISNTINDIIDSNPNYIKKIIDINDESTRYEAKRNIDMNNNSTRISSVYNDSIGKGRVKKTDGEKSIDVFETILCSLVGAIAGVSLSKKRLEIYKKLYPKSVINNNIETLKKRKKKK